MVWQHDVVVSSRVQKNPFLKKSPTQWVFGGGLLGFFGQAGKIGKIIQKL